MWLGDFAFGSTVHFKFTTVNSTGAPSAFSSGGVTAYRDGSTVQDTTGITLTSTFDTITGLNHVQIDMSTAGFYSSAGTYCAVVSSGAASEDLTGYVLAHWSLEDRRVLSTAGLETGSTHTATEAADLVWDTTRASHTIAGTFGEIVSTSTGAPNLWVESSAAAGSGLNSTDTAAAVWNATRANFAAAGSFGQIVSTSTAAPNVWAAISTAGLETLSTAGLETVSTAGLETLSTLGIETLSTAGLETLSTAGLETFSTGAAAASVWNATRASFTAAGSFGQIVSTSTAAPDQWVAISTAGLETLSTAGLETLSSAGLETLSTAGLETLSSAGLETLSTLGIETLSTAGLETASSVTDAHYFAGSSLAVENVAPSNKAIVRFTVGSGSSSTAIVLSSVTPAIVVADQYKGMLLQFDADTATANLRSQETVVSGNSTAANPVIDSTDALTTAPASGDTGSIR